MSSQRLRVRFYQRLKKNRRRFVQLIPGLRSKIRLVRVLGMHRSAIPSCTSILDARPQSKCLLKLKRLYIKRPKIPVKLFSLTG